MDVYRTSAGGSCPDCSNPALREFETRLVCDECAGMLLELDELATSVHELDGDADPATVSEPTPTQKKCPRCAKEMQEVHVEIGKLDLKTRLLHCDTHGVWMPREVMTAVFARASRRAHAGRAAGRTYGGVSGGGGGGGGGVPSYFGHGGMNAAMSSIASAFGHGGPASSALAISNWGASRPRVHTLFVSAHKGKTLGCPACKDTKLQYEGERWTCSTCAGCFVEDAALTAMVMEMTNTPWTVPDVKGGPGDRNCPVCETPMIVEVLEAVTIDRCKAHGVWFDDTELQSALHHASTPDSGGVGSWLKQLFRRHGKTED
jgi:Zn-finger nucleic acid-binding protein